MSIATMRGDGGETGLAGGIRVSKSSDRVEAYGTIDELISTMGFARSICADEEIGALHQGRFRRSFSRSARRWRRRRRGAKKPPEITDAMVDALTAARAPHRSDGGHSGGLVDSRRAYRGRGLRRRAYGVPPRRAAGRRRSGTGIECSRMCCDISTACRTCSGCSAACWSCAPASMPSCGTTRTPAAMVASVVMRKVEQAFSLPCGIPAGIGPRRTMGPRPQSSNPYIVSPDASLG